MIMLYLIHPVLVFKLSIFIQAFMFILLCSKFPTFTAYFSFSKFIFKFHGTEHDPQYKRGSLSSVRETVFSICLALSDKVSAELVLGPDPVELEAVDYVLLKAKTFPDAKLPRE